MIPQGHAVITRISVDQSLVGKANNLVTYTFISGNGAHRKVNTITQPFEFEVFTSRNFSQKKEDDLREEYFKDLQKRIQSQKNEQVRLALTQVQETLEQRVKLFETKSHNIGIIAPTHTFNPIRKVIGAYGLVPKTTQVKNAFCAPLILAAYDGKSISPTSTPLDLTDILDEVMVLDIETTNYDLKALKEKEMHAPYESVRSLYEKECKLHGKRVSTKHLNKNQMLEYIHLLRNDGLKKRLSGTMLVTSKSTRIITEVDMPFSPPNVQLIVTKNPGKKTDEILHKEKPLIVATHYGLGFDNPEFDDLTGGHESHFSHNTKGGSVHIYARSSSIDVDTMGGRHIPGIVNGKLPTLASAYTKVKTRKPMTHPELELNIQLALKGDAGAIAKVLNYMNYDAHTQKTLAQILVKPLLHLTRIFETTPVSIASSDPSTIVKSYVERKFERMQDITFFPKYLWDLKRKVEQTDLKVELAQRASFSHPLQPGLYSGTLVWCHPQIGAVAPQIKHPVLKELFEAQRDIKGTVKQLHTTFAQQFSEHHIVHARLMKSKAYSYAFDRFKNDSQKIPQAYEEQCQRVRATVHDAIAFDGNLALFAAGKQISDDTTFTTIGEGKFFVHDYETFIGEVDGALRRTKIADPSSKAGKKSYLEQKIMYQFYGEYFDDPIEALRGLNEHVVDIRNKIATGDIAELCVRRKLKHDPPKKAMNTVQRLAREQKLTEGDEVVYRDNPREIERDLFTTTNDYKPIGTLATIAYMAGIRGPHLHDFLTKIVEPQPVSVSRGIQQELF